VIRNNISRISDDIDKTRRFGTSILIDAAHVQKGIPCLAKDKLISLGVYHNTHSNTVRNVEIYDNDFEFGGGNGIQIHNVTGLRGGQYGDNNRVENVRISDNRLTMNNDGNAILVSNYYEWPDFNDEGAAGECKNNSMSNILIENNTIINSPETHGYERFKVGINVSGANMTGGMTNEIFPYSGSMSDIIIRGNTIIDFPVGIILSGLNGAWGEGFTLENVQVSDNIISTMSVPLHYEYGVWRDDIEFGIIAMSAGMPMLTNRPDSLFPTIPVKAKNNILRDVVISGNKITGKNNILIAGALLSDYPYLYNPGQLEIAEYSGNTVENITLWNNTFTLRDGADSEHPLVFVTDIYDHFNLYGDAVLAGNAARNVNMRVPVTTRPTASAVLVNGEDKAFDAYNINDNNYFKLRDIAYVLSGTAKQFEVEWIRETNTITLASGQPYTIAGGEMIQGDGTAKTATPATARIFLDGREVQLTAYFIDGNNYFKLRDIGEAFDFGVEWDGVNNTVVIDTSKNYTP
jgi:hypothetical protein